MNQLVPNGKSVVFLTAFAKVAANYESMFRGLVKKYNKNHEEALPKVTAPHTLRHTFCTNLANAGMKPKALQYIMGHSNINMTLNYYAHATSDSALAEMARSFRDCIVIQCNQWYHLIFSIIFFHETDKD